MAKKKPKQEHPDDLPPDEPEDEIDPMALEKARRDARGTHESDATLARRQRTR